MVITPHDLKPLNVLTCRRVTRGDLKLLEALRPPWKPSTKNLLECTFTFSSTNRINILSRCRRLDANKGHYR